MSSSRKRVKLNHFNIIQKFNEKKGEVNNLYLEIKETEFMEKEVLHKLPQIKNDNINLDDELMRPIEIIETDTVNNVKLSFSPIVSQMRHYNTIELDFLKFIPT